MNIFIRHMAAVLLAAAMCESRIVVLPDLSQTCFFNPDTIAPRLSTKALSVTVIIPDIRRLCASRYVGGFSKEAGLKTPYQSRVPSDRQLLHKIGISQGETVFGFAGYSGDWLAALAEQGAAVTYSDIDPRIVEWVRQNRAGTFSAVQVADALISPENSQDYDWAFSYEPIPLEPLDWPFILMKAFLYKRGMVCLSSVGETGGWLETLEGFKQIYGLSGNVGIDEDDPEAFDPHANIQKRVLYVDSFRGQEADYPKISQNPFIALTIRSDDRARAMAKLDQAVIFALQSMAENKISFQDLIKSLQSAGIDADETALKASLDRVTQLTKLMGDKYFTKDITVSKSTEASISAEFLAVREACARLLGYGAQAAGEMARNILWKAPANEQDIRDIRDLARQFAQDGLDPVPGLVWLYAAHEVLLDRKIALAFEKGTAQPFGELADAGAVVADACRRLDEMGENGRRAAEVLRRLFDENNLYVIPSIPEGFTGHAGQKGIYVKELAAEALLHEALAYCFVLDHEAVDDILKNGFGPKTLEIIPPAGPSFRAARDYALAEGPFKFPSWWDAWKADKTKVSYYQIFGVEQGAGDIEIKKVYRRLSRQYHPDMWKDDSRAKAEDVFKVVNEAYETLSDEKKRASYDRAASGGVSEQDIYPPFSEEDIMQQIIMEFMRKSQQELNMAVQGLRARGITADAWGKQDVNGIFWAGGRLFMSIKHVGTDNKTSEVVSFDPSQFIHWDFCGFTHLQLAPAGWPCPGMQNPLDGSLFFWNGSIGAVIDTKAVETAHILNMDEVNIACLNILRVPGFNAALFDLEGTRGVICFEGLEESDRAFRRDGHLVFVTQTGIVVDWDIAGRAYKLLNINFRNSNHFYGTWKSSNWDNAWGQPPHHIADYVWPLYQPTVRISPDATMALVVYEDGYSSEDMEPRVEVWDIESNTMTAHMTAGVGFSNAAWEENGDILMRYDERGKDYVWDWAADMKKPVKKEKHATLNKIGTLAASVKEGTIKIETAAGGEAVPYYVELCFELHYSNIRPLSPDLALITRADSDENIELYWSPDSKRLLAFNRRDRRMALLKIMPRDTALLSGAQPKLYRQAQSSASVAIEPALSAERTVQKLPYASQENYVAEEVVGWHLDRILQEPWREYGIDENPVKMALSEYPGAIRIVTDKIKTLRAKQGLNARDRNGLYKIMHILWNSLYGHPECWESYIDNELLLCCIKNIGAVQSPFMSDFMRVFLKRMEEGRVTVRAMEQFLDIVLPRSSQDETLTVGGGVAQQIYKEAERNLTEADFIIFKSWFYRGNDQRMDRELYDQIPDEEIRDLFSDCPVEKVRGAEMMESIIKIVRNPSDARMRGSPLRQIGIDSQNFHEQQAIAEALAYIALTDGPLRENTLERLTAYFDVCGRDYYRRGFISDSRYVPAIAVVRAIEKIIERDPGRLYSYRSKLVQSMSEKVSGSMPGLESA